MTLEQDRYRRICEIADHVLVSPPAERREVLQKACGNDAELLESVEIHIGYRERNARDPLLASTDNHALPETEAAQPGTDAPARHVGRRLGGFRLEEELGRGGMGVVYRAHHSDLNRTVAVKTIRFDREANPDELERFQGEARAAAKLRHPNIVAIHDIGIDNGVHFFSMDFIAGETLQQQGVVRPHSIAAELCRKIALAVEHAHANQVVHRDLKPANILIDEDGAPHVADFGLALRLDADERLTQDGSLLGTPGYMAPEQADCRDDVGRPADIYALGGILYFMLTGRPPFAGDSLVATLDQIRSRDPIPPREYDAAVPRDLETICLKCLRKEPHQRYASADALATDLERYLASRPIHARPVGAFEKIWLWSKRRPTAAALIALLAVLACVAPLSLNAWRSLTDQLGEATGEAEQSETRLREEVKKADFEKYVRRIGNACEQWRDGKLELAREELRQCPEHLRGWEWRYLTQACEPPRLQLGAAIRCLDMSHHGDWIAGGGGAGTITVWNRVSGDVAMTIHHPQAAPIGALAFSSNHLLASASGESIAVWDPYGKLTATLEGHTQPITHLVFDSTGSVLASAARDGTRVWDIGGGNEVFHAETPRDVTGIAFDASGQLLAVAGTDSLGGATIQLLDAVTAEVRNTIKCERPVADIAFSPKLPLLAAISDDGAAIWMNYPQPQRIATIPMTGANAITFTQQGMLAIGGANGVEIRHPVSKHLLQFRRGERVSQLACSAVDEIASLQVDQSIHVHGWPNTALSTVNLPFSFGEFSGDGHRMVASAPGSPTSLVFNTLATYEWSSGALVDSSTGRPPLMIQRPDPAAADQAFAGQFGVAIAPDGKRIAMGDKTVVLYDAETGEVIRTLKGHTGVVTNLVFSGDGDRLAAAGPEETSVWNLRSPKPPTKIPVARTSGLAFSPDGSRLVVSVQTPDYSENENSEDWISVFDSDSGKRIHKLLSAESGRLPICVAYGSQGKHIAAALGEPWQARKERAETSQPFSVQVWSAATGRPLHSFHAHENGVAGVAFSPDEERIATAGVDGTVSIWTNSDHAARLLTLAGLSGQAAGAPAPSMRVMAGDMVDEGRVRRGFSAYTSGTGKSTVRFSRDGAKLMAFGSGRWLIWDTAPVAFDIENPFSTPKQTESTTAPPPIASLPANPPTAPETADLLARQDIVHHFGFDEDLRDSAGDAQLTAHGNAKPNGESRSGKASLSCSAGPDLNAVTVRNVRLTATPAGLSIALWFKPTRATKTLAAKERRLPRLLEAYQGRATFALGYSPAEQTLFFAGRFDGRKNYRVTSNRLLENPIARDQWNHVVLVNNRQTWSLYVNGKSFAGASNVPLFPPLKQLTIGGLERGVSKPGDRDFHGLIDEVTIFRGALTTKEIQRLYNDPTLPARLLEPPPAAKPE